ncbi:NAD nucleotidase [Neptunomonas phycophila]|uniref:NAD nucleotidase n=1 Tax=Neptunomonas phycophila TaxID=1572645 RepID=A0ABT9EQB9_9GAMM|nr:NAD nucleotidase [Neptunomonas phycophila]MDP2521146.1 NAD nucleotidase [Neptunomonas phycophila]
MSFYRHPRLAPIALAVTMAALTGCNNSKDDESTLSLRVVHINDHHSHLQSESASLTIDGVETDVTLGGFPRVVSMINQLSNSSDPVLKLHAGDAITGDLYYTLFKGEADAALMNQVCFDAFELGNHEFDDGDSGLVSFLDDLNSGNCNTTVLGANVAPEVGVSPLAQNTSTDYIQPYLIKSYGDQKVGIIGLDIASKTKNSSSPDATTEFLDETATAQSYIDELKEQGINQIILLTHYQYENDLTLAANLTDVDVIVGGDSHTLLGNEFEDFGLNPAGPYPTQVTNKDGNPVCVVQAWQYSYVVGELNVEFNNEGNIESCTGQPHLLLGNEFSRDDINGDSVSVTGNELAAIESSIEASPVLDIVEEDATSATILEGYSEQVDVLKTTVIGSSNDDLCLERIPGQGQSTLCSASETQSQGSDISNLVALAFKTMSITSDIAIQNAGGVRTDIAMGDITIGDAYTLLPFANTLSELSMTGAEIIAVLEDAYDYALSPDGSTGAYPYASGLRWDVDSSQTKGNRFTNVQVKLKDETVWRAIDETETYTVVTNNYIAQGRDGYDTFGVISAQGRVVDTFLDYAQSFVDYVEEQGSISKLPSSEYSTQMFYDTDGNLQ